MDQNDFSWGRFALSAFTGHGLFSGLIAALAGGVVVGSFTGGSDAGIAVGAILAGVGTWLAINLNFAMEPPDQVCPQCRDKVPGGAKVCKSCGAKLT